MERETNRSNRARRGLCAWARVCAVRRRGSEGRDGCNANPNLDSFHLFFSAQCPQFRSEQVNRARSLATWGAGEQSDGENERKRQQTDGERNYFQHRHMRARYGRYINSSISRERRSRRSRRSWTFNDWPTNGGAPAVRLSARSFAGSARVCARRRCLCVLPSIRFHFFVGPRRSSSTCSLPVRNTRLICSICSNEIFILRNWWKLLPFAEMPRRERAEPSEWPSVLPSRSAHRRERFSVRRNNRAATCRTGDVCMRRGHCAEAKIVKMSKAWAWNWNLFRSPFSARSFGGIYALRECEERRAVFNCNRMGMCRCLRSAEPIVCIRRSLGVEMN